MSGDSMSTPDPRKRAKAEAEERKKMEEARKEAEKKAKREEEEKRKAAEVARKEAEKKAVEEARLKGQQEVSRKRKEEEDRRRALQVARKEAERKRREAEMEQRETERRLKEENERAKRALVEKAKAEERSAKEALRKAREEAERLQREAEAKKRAEELAAKEEERKAKQQAEVKTREEARARKELIQKGKEEAERRKKEEEGRRKEAREMSKAEAKPLQTPGAPKAKVADVERSQRQEVMNALKRVNVRFPATGTAIPPAWRTLEKYPVNSPFAYAVVAQSPLGVKRYFLDEVPLSKVEAGLYSYLLDALEDELTVPRTEVNPRQFFADQARRILLKYSIVVPSTSWAKIIYFAERDLVGFGLIDGLMRDPNIEDISLDAVGKPIFVYHKGHESLETNITMNDDDTLDNLVTRLSHMAGKHVSTAFPIVQGTLPGRHRLVATFRREISPLGSSATIRKFREDPLTVIDMLSLGVLDHRIAAYLWLLMQNRATATVVGATGAGKTTLMNALLTLTRLTTKVVSIEEVQEINISHQNWTSLVSRESYAATEEKAGEVGLFELVKAAMRMRPDILVVGEVRGEEAYVLFQAISTGHGGLCTLHADDASSALQRLTSQPMNVPQAFIPFLDLLLVVRRISVTTPSGGFKSIRRVISVDEILSARETNQVFKWDAKGDIFQSIPLEKSVKIQRVSRDLGMPIADVVKEVERRSTVLRWLQQKGIRNFRELSPMLELYATRPEETFERAGTELQAIGIPATTARSDITK